MIGKVVFQYKLDSVEAVMGDDGAWRCDAIPCLVRPLNLLYSPLVFGESLERDRSVRCLESAAKWLRGEVHVGRADDLSSLRPDRRSAW
jgi:hypothetical protein